jgi:hypothetical protein
MSQREEKALTRQRFSTEHELVTVDRATYESSLAVRQHVDRYLTETIAGLREIGDRTLLQA